MAAEARPIRRSRRRDHRRRTRDRQGDRKGAGRPRARAFAIGDLGCGLAAETAAQLGGGAIATELDGDRPRVVRGVHR